MTTSRRVGIRGGFLAAGAAVLLSVAVPAGASAAPAQADAQHRDAATEIICDRVHREGDRVFGQECNATVFGEIREFAISDSGAVFECLTGWSEREAGWVEGENCFEV